MSSLSLRQRLRYESSGDVMSVRIMQEIKSTHRADIRYSKLMRYEFTLTRFQCYCYVSEFWKFATVWIFSLLHLHFLHFLSEETNLFCNMSYHSQSEMSGVDLTQHSFRTPWQMPATSNKADYTWIFKTDDSICYLHEELMTYGPIPVSSCTCWFIL